MKSGGLIGFGYWGKNLLRALKKIKPSLSLYVFDSSSKARRSALEKGFFVCSSLTEILSKEISFLIIATPPATHASLVKKGLSADKNVLVEKPFGWHTDNKASLFKMAQKKKRVLMVDWTYLYSPGFKKLKELLAHSKMTSYESLRCNSEFARTDINVVDDLIIHDLAMLLDIAPSKPLYCSCQSLNVEKKAVAQQGIVSITGQKWRAFIYGSRVFSEKQRLVLVKSSKKEIEFKEASGQTYVRFLHEGKSKNAPVKNKSSLELMLEEFFNRIREPNHSSDLLRYKKISTLLTALNRSLNFNGKTIKIH